MQLLNESKGHILSLAPYRVNQGKKLCYAFLNTVTLGLLHYCVSSISERAPLLATHSECTLEHWLHHLETSVCVAAVDGKHKRWERVQQVQSVPALPSLQSLLPYATPHSTLISQHANQIVVITVQYRRFLLVTLNDASPYDAALFVIPKRPIGYSTQSATLDTDRALRATLFGQNFVSVPSPTFVTLLLQVLVHPFFVFQLFSITVWILEDYRLYAATILLISIFSAFAEASEIMGNSVRLARLASAQGVATACTLYPSLQKLSAKDLVPGDLFRLEADTCVPCDCVLVAGSCVVNESPLTGESAPVRKSISRYESSKEKNESSACDEIARGESDHRRDMTTMLFAGTHLLASSDDAVARVLAVGCSTVRGELVRDLLLQPDTPMGWMAGKPANDELSAPLLKVPSQREDISLSGREYLLSGDEPRFPNLFADPRGALGRSRIARAFQNMLHHPDFEICTTLLALLALGVIGALWTVKVLTQQFKLTRAEAILESLDLITIAVPPALPATVTFGLAFAISRLKRARVLCVRSGAISRAAFVDEILFDKTGTLTESGLRVYSIYETRNADNEAGDHPPQPIWVGETRGMGLSSAMRAALAICHSLSVVNGQPAGDELDKQLFSLSKWTLVEQAARPHQPVSLRVVEDGCEHNQQEIMRLLAFNSELKRMGTLAISSREKGSVSVVIKGAPEEVARICDKETLPQWFHDTTYGEAACGRRVIAIAKKVVPNRFRPSDLFSMPRDELEQGLSFMGLVVLANKPKKDTKTVLDELVRSAHFVPRMLTGDHIATALSVAKQCGIVKSPRGGFPRRRLIIVDMKESYADPELTFVDARTSVELPATTTFESLYLDRSLRSRGPIDFVVSGSVCHQLLSQHTQGGLVPFVLRSTLVFARMSPSQKADIVRAYGRFLGARVLMCGDGANDIGAIRAAYSGIAIQSHDMQTESDSARTASGRPTGRSINDGEHIPAATGDSGQSASLSAPFTCDSSSIRAVVDIIRQGRSAVAASLSAFEYIFLYSLIQFSSVILLYWQGAEFGDPQFLVADLLLVMPLGILSSRSDAASRLTPAAPPNSVWDKRVAAKTLGYAFIQIAAQALLISAVLRLAPVERMTGHLVTKCEAVTALFLLTNWQYIIASVALNRGPPFRKPLATNRLATAWTVAVSCLQILLTMQVFPRDGMIPHLLQLRALSSQIQHFLITATLADVASTFLLCKMLT